MNTLEVKREALAKERIGNKYKSHKDCTFQPMKLSEIETADLPVREMTITHCQITILYDEVYHIPTQSYTKNIQITITNWRELLVKIFLSPAPYIKPTEVICEGAQREVFDLIQEITFLDNTLILKGISKENQYWMEYYITEGQWVLL